MQIDPVTGKAYLHILKDLPTLAKPMKKMMTIHSLNHSKVPPL
jgi:hypothetical protein